jgi:hypothetical protein
MSLMSEDDVYRAMAARLRRQPNPHIWKHLEAQGWIEGAISLGAADDDAVISLDEVVDQYHQLESLTKAVAAGDETNAGPKRQMPPDAALEAATRIAAIEAAADPFVLAFRERILAGQLLSVDAAWEWLRTQNAGRHLWFRLFLPPWYPRNAVARTTPWEAKASLEAYAAGGSLQGGTASDTALDFLYCLCDVLVDRYAWDDYGEGVALFVLSGETPRPLAGTFMCQPLGDSGDLLHSMIAIYVSARLGPKELMAEYADFRRDLLAEDTRARAVSERVARMAVFIAQINDGRSWRDAMQAWNAVEPAETVPYSATYLFSRDCRHAYLRVTGRPLLWRNGRELGSLGRAQEAREAGEGAASVERTRRPHEELKRLSRERSQKNERSIP